MEERGRQTKRVLVLSTFDSRTMEAIENDPSFIVGEVPREASGEYSSDFVAGLVVRSGIEVDRILLDRMPNLKFVIRAGSGTDNIEVDELSQRGIKLVRNASLSAEAVAELALTGLLSLVRRIPEAAGLLKMGVWAKSELVGQPLSQLKVAIWGAGPVGLACYHCLRDKCASIRFAHWTSLPNDIRCLGVAAETLINESDVHIVALPARPQNVGLFNQDFLGSARHKRPYLVNIGRYDLIDNAAAISALESGFLRGLFVDPIDSGHVPELRALLEGKEGLNLIVTQHLGAQRTDVSTKMGKWVICKAKELLG